MPEIDIFVHSLVPGSVIISASCSDAAAVTRLMQAIASGSTTLIPPVLEAVDASGNTVTPGSASSSTPTWIIVGVLLGIAVIAGLVVLVARIIVRRKRQYHEFRTDDHALLGHSRESVDDTQSVVSCTVSADTIDPAGDGTVLVLRQGLVTRLFFSCHSTWWC